MVPTREHWRIEQWAHGQGAIPAQKRRLKVDGQPAILTFLFGELESAAYEDIDLISWEMFFAQFDLMELSMSFDEESSDFWITKVVNDRAGDPIH